MCAIDSYKNDVFTKNFVQEKKSTKKVLSLFLSRQVGREFGGLLYAEQFQIE